MASSSMAGELFDLLSPYSYTNIIAHLMARDILAQKSFGCQRLSNTYWLHTRKCYKHRRKNSQQLFKIFAVYNDDEPENVHKLVLDNIIKDKELYMSVGQEHLHHLKINIDAWIKLMSSNSVFGDELMIYPLLRTYQRQTVVFTSRGFWMTLGSDDPIRVNRIMEICDIKLLYIGLHMYGELRRKPFVPVTAQALLEAPDSILPSITTELDSTPNAMDLMVKQQQQQHQEPTNVYYDSSSTEGSESSTPYVELDMPSHHCIESPAHVLASSDSDTPS